MREPIAIVGIGCRFPGGVDSPDDLTQLLVAKRSAIGNVPSDRWDRDAFFHPDFRKPGYLHVKRGGFVSRVDEFDAAFFGISPNEAKRMDPQQRLILEVAFAAVEDAGMRLEQLAGRSVAVTVGAGLSDYGGLNSAPSERHLIAGTSNPGSALSIVSNRISYLFDLRGPSFTVDTACSSSLTALHLACRAIWEGSAEAALTGGANVILKPETTLGFSKGGYLSPDAECRAFSDDANGYVRSEGVAIALLKPLRRALADGDRIYALIRSTWINQDGRTNGMTVPSQSAQEELIRSAFDDAGIDPASAGYIEAHGTGTPAGDPIEATAIGRVIGTAAGRKAPCYIGSVKTNLGHMEFTAGMGGLIKLALVLQRREVLPNINFRRPNRALDLDALGLKVATECVRLPAEGPLFGGLNSFGFGGANGHVVLESPPAVSASATRSVSVPVSNPAPSATESHAFVFSARSQTALCAMADSLAGALERDQAPLADVAAALMSRRSRFDFRAAVTGTSREQIVRGLRAFAESGSASDDTFVGRAREGKTEKVAFVFTGQGAQWWAMGRALLGSNATFRGVIERVEAELTRLGWLSSEKSTLRAELMRDKATSRIGETQIAQPCLFALQVGLTELLKGQGITPSATVGHSIGELAAAVAAEALTLEEATRIVYWRSRCQAMAEGKGAMAALGVTEAEARALSAKYPGEVEIAAVNGPTAITIAGAHEAVAAIVKELETRGTFCRRLDISVPFHCYLMDGIEADFRAGLGPVASKPARIPFTSTVTGGLHEGPLDLGYWYDNIRQPVLYAEALRSLAKSGINGFLEVGPHPALMHGSLDTLRELGVRATYVPTLRREGDDSQELARAVAKLFVFGASCEPTAKAAFVDLPRYPFERQRFWLETEAGGEARRLPHTRVHPHIGHIERSVHAGNVFACQLVLDPKIEPYLAEHRAQGHIVFPAAGQGEVVIAAARHVFGAIDVILEEVEFRRPMILSSAEDESTTFRLEIYADDGHFVIASKVSDTWVEHTRGCVRRSKNGETPRFDLDALRGRIDVEVSTADRYRAYQRAGLELGPQFRGIARSHRSIERTESLAEIESHPNMLLDAPRFVVHPALVDASVQAGMPIDPERGDSQQLYLPNRAREIRFFGPVPEGRIWAYVRQRSFTAEEASADVDVMDDHGVVFMRFTALTARVVNGPTNRFGGGLIYDHAWRPSERVSSDRSRVMNEGSWLVLGNERSPELTRVAVAELRKSGARIVQVVAGNAFRERDKDLFEVRPGLGSDFEQLARTVGGSIAGIVCLWSAEGDASSGSSALDATRMGALPVGHLVTAITEARLWASRVREVWLVTEGATAVVPQEGRMNLGASTMWGFGRVLMSEHPRLTTTLVDVRMADATELAAELAAGPTDAEVAFREGKRFVRAVTRGEEPKLGRATFDAKTDAVRAAVRTPGVLESVTLERIHIGELLSDDVEIAVHAASLNFRDVVGAMNLLPKSALDGGFIGATQLGSDAAGIVTRVGSGVSHLRPGDRVFGYFNDCLATRVVGKAAHVAKIAPGVSFEAAAALPLAFLTVDVALNELARLKKGETILIHAAAGGVGAIAVQMAMHMGANVIATTSTEDKRAFLKSLGVVHIFNSRTADFGDEILELTNGRGVDVVLNSLSGPAVTESLRCLRAFGRFIEIGKSDVYKNRQIGLLSLADNKTYACLDANRFVNVARSDAVFQRAMDAITGGMIKNLPLRRFPLTEAGAALRALAQGKTIGKIIVDVPTEGPIEADGSTELVLDPSAVYLVTGGCAGFGLALAEWLAEKGARKLVLVGRRGLPSNVETAKVAALEARGVKVEVRKADVSERSAVEKLVADTRALGRLAGVFHAATVLDDAPIGALSEERYARVLAAKAHGALYLHEATQGLELDHFVLFSSIASVIGTPGQANYAAANGYLDELAAWRKTLGLRATSINWGVIDDVGMVARASLDQRRKILGRGICGLPSTRGFEMLERILLEGSPRRVVADLDARRLTQLPSARRRFASLVGKDGEATATPGGESLRAELQKASEEARLSLLTGALASIIGSVAGLGDQKIDLDTSLGRYGFDSLMIAQLQTWIEEQLGVTIAMVHLMRGPTTNELARELLPKCLEGARQDGSETGSMLTLLSQATPNSGARFALVCFSPMGMGSEVFAALSQNLPEDVALYGLELPSLSGPDASLLLRSTEEQHAAMMEAIETIGPVPFAFYGHSMGGYIALEVARSLRASGNKAPSFVALGAVPIPEAVAALVPEGIQTPDEITDNMVEEALAQLSGSTDAVQAPAQVRERVRRDLWVTVRGRSENRLTVKVDKEDGVILLGATDDVVSTVDKLSPAELTRLGHHEVLSVPGSHMFVLEPAGRAAVAKLVTERITSSGA
jgi:polyketide synthase 12